MRAEPIRCFICIDVFLRRVSAAAAEERKYFFGFPASAGYASAAHRFKGAPLPNTVLAAVRTEGDTIHQSKTRQL